MVSAAWQNEFKAMAASIHSKGQSIAPSLAEKAVAVRNEAKNIARAQNTFLEKKFLGGRDHSSSYSKKNSEEAFYSAFKTGGADLGLENNGFDKTLEAWKILKKCGINDVYPEMINADYETVADFVYDFSSDCPDVDDILKLAGTLLPI